MSGAVSLVTAGPEDADAIRSLTRAAYARWVPLIGREPKPMLADYAAAVAAHRIDLLYATGTLVALIEMIPGDDHLLIENVAVSPAYQGQGYGRRLLDHAEDLAVALGYKVVRLYTNRRFGPNVEIYRARGYRIDREEPVSGGVAVYMSKPVGR